MRRSLAPAPGACALTAHADDVPLLGYLRTSAVVGAFACHGGYRHSLTARPRPSFRWSSAKSATFQKTGMPFTATHTKELFSRRNCFLRPSCRLSRSRRPHVIPRRGTCFWMGIARSRCGHPRIREHREYRRLLDSLDFPCLGLTTQARQRARPARPSTRTICLARTAASRSA